MRLPSCLKDGLQRDRHFKELIGGSSVALAFRITGIFCGYLFTLLVTRIFGADAMGIFALSITILQIASVAGRLGMDTALLRLVAEYSSQGRWGHAKTAYLKALKLVVPFSLILSVVLFLLSPYAAQHVFGKKQLTTAFYMVSLAVTPFSIFFINSECIRGLKMIREYTLLQNVVPYLLASLALVTISAYWKDNIVPLISYVVSVSSLFFISLFMWMKRLESNYRHGGPAASRSSSSSLPPSYDHLLSISLPMLLSSSLFFIMQWTDTIMLGMFRHEKEVGIYNVSMKIAMLATLTLFAINTISAPKFAEFWGQKDIRALGKVAQQASKLIFWTSLPICLTLWLFPAYILSFFGEEFRMGVPALMILTLGQFVNAVSGSVGYILQMTGKQKVFQHVVLSGAILNLILNAVLIPRFGMTGAAIASAFSTMLINVIPYFLVRTYYGFYTVTPGSLFS